MLDAKGGERASMLDMLDLGGACEMDSLGGACEMDSFFCVLLHAFSFTFMHCVICDICVIVRPM